MFTNSGTRKERHKNYKKNTKNGTKIMKKADKKGQNNKTKKVDRETGQKRVT